MEPGSPQSFNRYAYVNNDPVNHVDPTGLMLADIGVAQVNSAGQASQLNLLSVHNFLYSTNQTYKNAWDAKQAERQSIQDKTKEQFIAGMQASGAKRFENYFDPFTQNPHEQRLAAMFGGEGAVMRTRFDYNGRYRGLNADAREQARANQALYGRDPDFDAVWDSEHLFHYRNCH